MTIWVISPLNGACAENQPPLWLAYHTVYRRAIARIGVDRVKKEPGMSDDVGVDYGVIQDDYDFFLAHSNETAAQVARIRPHLVMLAHRSSPLRMLDVGCGIGAFTEALLRAADVQARRLDLTLVEPVAAHLARAARLLEPLACRVTPAGADVAALGEDRFDLILANHSLYYVPDAARTLRALLRRLAPGGRLIVALLDRTNPLARIWQAGFAAAGVPCPFNLAEDAEAILHAEGRIPVRETVHYRIAFPDDGRCTRRILRFLFGDHLSAVPDEQAQALFDAYRRGGWVTLDAAYPHVVVRASP